MQTELGSRQLECPNTSMRTLMDQARAAKRKELADAEASGNGADSVTGASMIYHRSPKERNRQVRLSCADVPASKLKDRARADSTRRWLFVFDSPKHPLRHTSYARSFRGIDETVALAEFVAAKDAMTAAFGPPSESVNEPLTLPMPSLKSYTFAWTFSDLRAFTRLMNMGDGRLSLDETIEVPWPVRSDAPQRK